ncbi:MAG: lysophospholipase [Candidatus Thiodiazotropha lotti]|nr:lysophospholipase [Candidatus Thiodiazotropha lotti]MCG8001014.1 lysophospholipase [Candidatus Thiodiazotropha lotti]MCW4182657.1 lysophospholipase [Candidatus Thiodiazotropha weberae]MCW4192788.1 lysophospholipase [Candidatus Thiodiazotropha weberae]
MFGTMISNMMVKPYQSPLFDSPENWGLDYESVEFPATDGTLLRGWLIRGGSDRVIVQSHFGVQCSRGGWTPKGKGLIKPWKNDISFLRQVKYLVENGYSVLMYDFRGHGESDLGPIPWVSWGQEEAKDVIGAVDYISTHPDFANASIGLLSICMGSAATTYAYGLEDGLSGRDRVKALVAVQPLLYSCFVDALGMPGFARRSGEKVTVERLGFDIAGPNFVEQAASISVPTLVVQNANDPWTQMSMVEDYYQRLTVEKELKMLDLDKSRFAAYDRIGTHPQEFTDWFDDHMYGAY